MQFQVPQFIEMEDKIFGPFTFKQFIYLAGGAGLAFVAIRFLPYPFNLPLAMAAGALGLAFAFVEIHKRPLIYFVEAAFWFLWRSKLYIWKKRKIKKKKTQSEQSEDSQVLVPALSENKLKDLAWGLDINEHIAQTRLKEQLKKQEDMKIRKNDFDF